MKSFKATQKLVIDIEEYNERTEKHKLDTLFSFFKDTRHVVDYIHELDGTEDTHDFFIYYLDETTDINPLLKKVTSYLNNEFAHIRGVFGRTVEIEKIDDHKCRCEQCKFEFPPINAFIQPGKERKYFYDLYDGIGATLKDMYKGRVYSKEEAQEWVAHGELRGYHEKLLCRDQGDKRCSNLCKGKE